MILQTKKQTEKQIMPQLENTLKIKDRLHSEILTSVSYTMYIEKH